MVPPNLLYRSYINTTQVVSFEIQNHVPFEIRVSVVEQVKSVVLVQQYSKRVWEMIKGDDDYRIKISPQKTGTFLYRAEITNIQGKKEWLTNDDGTIYEVEVQVDPKWLNDAVMYCVFVRFFKGKVQAEVVRNPAVEELTGITEEELRTKSVDPNLSILPGEGGTFDDVKEHLDVIKSMNINALYFNPIHLIGEIYRGYNMLDQLPSYLQPGSPYSIKDFKSIDPELTYDKDTKKHLLSDPAQEFRDLVKAAHDRDMYIIMDLVFNHTAHDFVFQRIRPEWYLYKNDITSLEEPYLYPEDVKKGKPWGDPKHSVPPYDHGVWWHDCAQLNWEYKLTPGPNEPPPNYSLHDMWEYFKSIPKYWINNFGIDGFRTDVAYRVPPTFWKECIREARDVARKAKNNLSNDVVFIAESYTSDLHLLQESGFAAVYGDFSHKVNKPVDLKGYLDYIYNVKTNDFPDGALWLHFPDSHDFDRSPRKVLGEDASNTKVALIANQSRWVLTACLPGIPLVFNGFEKVEWQPINIWSYGAIDWEKDVDLRDYIARVNQIRHKSKALRMGDYIHLNTNQGMGDKTQLFAFMRVYDEERVIIVVNMDVYSSAGPAIVYLTDEFDDRKYILKDEMSGDKFERKSRELTVKLDPGQSHIFTVKA